MSGPIVRTGTTPEFWKNYDNHFTDAVFLTIIQATQDYSGLTVAQALVILNNNGDQYHRKLLTAELNAAWNGDENNAGPGGQLSLGVYSNPAFPSSSLNGQTVQQINHLAFLTSPGSAGDDLEAYVLYAGADGENASNCLIMADCATPTRTATRTSTQTQSATPSRSSTVTATATSTTTRTATASVTPTSSATRSPSLTATLTATATTTRTLTASTTLTPTITLTPSASTSRADAAGGSSAS